MRRGVIAFCSVSDGSFLDGAEIIKHKVTLNQHAKRLSVFILLHSYRTNFK